MDGITTGVFNELLAELEKMHMITTDLRKDENGIFSGSIKINGEGISFYEEEINR